MHQIYYRKILACSSKYTTFAKERSQHLFSRSIAHISYTYWFNSVSFSKTELVEDIMAGSFGWNISLICWNFAIFCWWSSSRPTSFCKSRTLFISTANAQVESLIRIDYKFLGQANKISSSTWDCPHTKRWRARDCRVKPEEDLWLGQSTMFHIANITEAGSDWNDN